MKPQTFKFGIPMIIWFIVAIILIIGLLVCIAAHYGTSRANISKTTSSVITRNQSISQGHYTPGMTSMNFRR